MDRFHDLCKKCCYSFISKVKSSFHTTSDRSYCSEFSFWLSSAIWLPKKKSLFFSLWKFAKIIMSFLKVPFSFPWNFASIVGTIKQLVCTFLVLTYILVKSNTLNAKFLKRSGARVKIRQIPYVNFETTSQFSTLDKRVPSKSQFWDFQVLDSKFVIFLMPILKRQVNSASNFSSFCSFITHNSSVSF